MPTPLQDRLHPAQLARSYAQLEAYFKEGDFDLSKEIGEAMRVTDPDEPFVILDVGCGTGTAIEEIVRILPLKAIAADLHKKIEGIGIDVNPLPEQISTSIFLVNPGRRGFSMFDNPLMGMMNREARDQLRQLKSRLIRADVSQMPLEDESVNFGYSYATLIYVVDALKALEEGFRVLKPGGVMIFNVEDRWVSKTPSLQEIFNQTPGANEAFTYQPSLIDEHDGFIIIRKPRAEESRFEGFPYYLVDYVVPAGTAPDRGEAPQEPRDFHCAGIYKKYKKFLKILGRS